MKQLSYAAVIPSLHKLVLVVFLVMSTQGSGKADPFKGVYVIKTMQVDVVEQHYNALLKHLRLSGHDTSTLERNTFVAHGKVKAIDDYLASLKEKPRLIIPMATLASKHLKKYCEDRGIPMFFITVSQPVEAGLIQGFNQVNQGLVSGISHTIPITQIVDYVETVARLIKKSGPLRFSYVHSTYPSATGFKAKLNKELKERKALSLVASEFAWQPDKVDQMMAKYKMHGEKICAQVDFHLIPVGPLGIKKGTAQALLESCEKPIIFTVSQQPLIEGALLRIDSNEEEVGRYAASGVMAILGNKEMSKIPPQQVKSVKLGVNLRKAKELGIAFPSNILKLSIHNLVR